MIGYDASLAGERKPLDAVVAATGFALRNERLSAELRARVNELGASTARIVEAGDRERRRLERNLPDGAQQRRELDALNPLPPDFYTCMPTGGGAVCQGEHTGSYTDGFDGTSPQGSDILENGDFVERATRFYDSDGNLVRRQLHDNTRDLPTNILFNSVTGKSVHYVSSANALGVLTVPGDLSSIVTTSTGNAYTVTGPGGLLVKDAGLMITDPAGNVLESRGPKMLFTGATEKLCAALT